MAHCRLYLISPPAIELPQFAEALEEAFAGRMADPHPNLPPSRGKENIVGAFQLRLKNASDAEILKAAEVLLPICQEHGAAFIMNDRPDLAVKCNADGVHLGQDDMSIQDARAIIGEDRIIGVSCHDSRHLAMEAGEQGADYVAFGAFYPTKSKSPDKLARYGTPKPDILQWWQEFMVLPCVAIGGITPANCPPLVAAGADFIAAITAVWEHPKGPKRAVEEFSKRMTG